MENITVEKKHRLRRILIRTAFVLITLAVVGVGYAFAVDAYVRHSSSDRMITPDEARDIDADCILVLGAGVSDDGTPSLLLRDRLETGTALYLDGVSDRLLMSGDHGRKDYDEVNSMKDYAVGMGADPSEVFTDHAGFSTYESLYRAKEVFGADKIIIVTQEYHLYRALYIAEQLDIEAYGVACKDIRYGGQDWRDFREILARNKDFLYCMIEPEPWSVGELRYPLDGDASSTDG